MMAPRAPSARDFPLLALAVLAWLAFSAWARPLMLPDEGRYVGVAWEMLRSGDWLTPTLNGLPYFHKPPLFYWITAGSLSLFGLHEWAARAAPILGAWMGACATYLFVRRWWSERAARLALVALALQPLFFVGGQFANLDMLVAGCITATITLAADAALRIEHGQPYRRVLAAAFAMAALGVLAKGLIGGVIPVLVIGAWLVLRRRWRVLGRLFWWPGLLVFLLIAAPWFVAMQMRFADFLDYFFVVQHFKRFAEGGFNNMQPFWFYPVVLLGVSLPWLPWLYATLRRGTRRESGPAPVRLLMVLWVTLVVLFFSLPQSKLLGYVLPAVPPLAVLMAEGLLSLGEPTRRRHRWWVASGAVSAAAGLALVVGLALTPPNSHRELAAALAREHAPHEPVVMLGNYYFDVPFYARLAEPAVVVEAWHSPEIALRDNWRKELADAGHFAPGRASAVLVDDAALPARLCVSPVSWVIGPSQAAGSRPYLADAHAVFTRQGTTLWRVDRAQPATARQLGCAEKPSDDLAGR